MEEETHVKGAEWQAAIGVMMIGYAAMQVPSASLAPKLPFHILIPALTVSWGIIVGLLAAIHSPGPLLLLRFFLGVIEAPLFPCTVYYLSCFYTSNELGLRIAVLVSGTNAANAFAGLAIAGILKSMDGITKLSSWRWLFIIEGAVTVLVGIGAFLALPKVSDGRTNLHSERENHQINSITTQSYFQDQKSRETAQSSEVTTMDSSSSNDLSTPNSASNPNQPEQNLSIRTGIQLALTDRTVLLIALIEGCISASIAYGYFLPSLIASLLPPRTSSPFIALLLCSPPHVLTFFSVLFVSIWADRRGDRAKPALVCLLFAIFVAAVLVGLSQHFQGGAGWIAWSKYAALSLLPSATLSVHVNMFAWLVTGIEGPRQKRAAAIGGVNMVACLSGFGGSFVWVERFGPEYTISWALTLGLLVTAIAGVALLKRLLRRREAGLQGKAHGEGLEDEAGVAGEV